MKLNFKKLGNGFPLFILHGVFGSLDNWLTVGKGLGEHFTVYLIDQRNHGGSPHDDLMTYEAMADDIAELMDAENLKSIYLLGHSMGGKTAMTFSMHYPEKLAKLVVVDIAPKYYPPHHQQIFAGFHSVKLDLIASRKEAEEVMAQEIKDFGVRQFILKNLGRDSDGKFFWKVNLPVIEKNIEIVGQGLQNEDMWAGDALFIGGAKSQYIQTEDEITIKKYFPKAVITHIEGTGHWVHAEKPKELFEHVVKFLS